MATKTKKRPARKTAQKVATPKKPWAPTSDMKRAGRIWRTLALRHGRNSLDIAQQIGLVTVDDTRRIVASYLSHLGLALKQQVGLAKPSGGVKG